MGFFLPSETARLVLSYLLDQKFQQTGEQFMGECPHIQELKGLPESQLRHCSKINGRTLHDVLKEYAGLISGITSLASEVSQDEFENLQFMPPLKVLKSLEQILKTKADIPGTRVDKVTNATQTSSISDKSGISISTQTPVQNSQPQSKKQAKAVITQEGSCQTNLNLLNFSPPIPKIIQSTEVQTEEIVSEKSIAVQTQKVFVAVDASPVVTESADNSPVKINPLVLNFNDVDDNTVVDQDKLAGPNIKNAHKSAAPKGKVPFFHSNIRVMPRQGYVPILPKPPAEPTEPPVSVTKKKEKGNLSTNSTATSNSLVSSTPISENNFQSRLLSGETSQSTPSQEVKVKESRKLRPPKKNKDSDEEFLNELLGIGDKIASLIPQNVTNQNISDIADKGLENRDLMENLLNVLEDFGDADESDDSRVNTPVTSPLPDAESRENLSSGSDSVEADPGAGQVDDLQNEFSKGFDADLSVSTVEGTTSSPVKQKEASNSNVDKLAMIINETINTVTEPFNPPSLTKATKTRKRKASPRQKNNPKKNRTTDSNNEANVQVSTSPQVVPPPPLEVVPSVQPGQLSSSLSKFRTQLKSVISKGGDDATTEDTGPVIDDNPILTRLALITRKTFDRNLELIEVKEEEDGNLPGEACEVILEESEVKEEEIHITDILPEMEIIVNDQLVEDAIPALPKHTKKGPRCRKCAGCKRADCGKCRNCKDKVKFGGDGHLKQACVYKVCENQTQAKDKILAEMDVPVAVENIAMESPNNNDKENDPLDIEPIREELITQQPVHVRNLVFSPPKNKEEVITPKKSNDFVAPETSGIKTLSPIKNSSPIKRTNSAWNKDVKNMFSSNAGKDSKDPVGPTTTAPQPLVVKSAIPFTENVVKNLKTPITIAKKIAIPINLQGGKVIPISPSAIPPGSIVTPLPPGFKSAGFKAILADTSASNPLSAQEPDTTTTVAKPTNVIASSITEPVKPQPTMPIIEPGDIMPAKRPAGAKSPKSKSKTDKTISVQSWDEKLRANLGAADKDTSHITNRPDKERRGRRRSPRKKKHVEKHDSAEDSDQDSLPEIDFGEQNITPEAQNILDTFANRLLEQLEENVKNNVVRPPPSPNQSPHKKLFGKPSEKSKDDKNCICCKMEKVMGRQKQMEPEPEKGKRIECKEKEANQQEKEAVSLEKEVVSGCIESDQSGPASQLGSSKTDSTTPTSKTPKKSEIFQFKTPVKTSLTTPQKASLLSPRTPRSRHIPASPLHQFSPRGSRLAIPLTPSRKSPSPSRTPSRSRHPSSLDTPILNTPNPDMGAPSIPSVNPVTPNCKNSPAPSYYTPSPSSQHSFPSPLQTPGLKFLQEEGARLSCSEDSMSPTKADQNAKRKTFRNLFKKSVTGKDISSKSIAGRELGNLLEQKISSYPFSSTSQAPLNPDMIPHMEPFMSPAGQSSYDYTSSPQIVLGRPSPSEDPAHASFVSPNRTCYLSPTGVALSSTVLGFHQSPAHTDSDNTDLELEEPSINKSKTVAKITAEAADDKAVLDTEESIEAIEAHLAQSCPSSLAGLTRCLEDESNSTSLPQTTVKEPVISEEMLDRISPEFPALQLSDDSETDDGTDNDEDDSMEVSEVESSAERKVKSDEATSKTATAVKPSFTPRKPRRVALTSTARRSPLKNDSTKFELQHDANNLDKNRNEEAEHLLEAGRLKKLGKSEKEGKEVSMISYRSSPRKRKTLKTPLKSGHSSNINESLSQEKETLAKELSRTPPSKKQKVPEKAEFDEGKELSLMFSPIKVASESTVTSHDLSSDPVIVMTVSPSKLPGVSVNIEKMAIPAKIMAPDSPAKSVSLPPTPESPIPLGPSRSPTPTICKALGLQRSGSKTKASTKDLNKSWTQAIWGLENVNSLMTEENANNVIGVGDGQSLKRACKGRLDDKSKDEEWTPENRRNKSKSREESKTVDKDADLVLEQLRMNKPKTRNRQRSESTDKSKRRGQGRSRSPQPSKDSERRSRDQCKQKEQKSKETKSKPENVQKVAEKASKGRADEERFSPKRTRSREKSEAVEAMAKQGHKSRDSIDEKLVAPRLTRASSKDKLKTGKDGSKEKLESKGTVGTKEKAEVKRKEDNENNILGVPSLSTDTKVGPAVEKELPKSSKEPRKTSKDQSRSSALIDEGIKPKGSSVDKPNLKFINKAPEGAQNSSKPIRSKSETTQKAPKVEASKVEKHPEKSKLSDSERSVKPVSSPAKRTEGKTIPNILRRSPVKSRETILGEIEVTTGPQPLDINQLAEKSAQILSSLSSFKNQKISTVTDKPAESDDSSNSTTVLSRSPFFVFLNQLPFGVFEEDLQ